MYGVHRLGTPVSGNDIHGAFAAAGLDWGTVLRPCGWKNLKTGEYQEIDNRFAVVRTDNGAVVDVGVSSQFHTHHNRVVADLLTEVSKRTGLKVTHVGETASTVFAYANLEGAKGTIAKGDVVRGTLRITFPHASGRSIRTALEIIRLVCTNGLTTSERVGSVTSHRRDFAADIARIADMVPEWSEKSMETINRMRRLSESEARAEDIRRWAHELTTGERVLRQAIAGSDYPVSGATVLDQIVQADTAARLTTDQMNRAGRAILDAVTNSPGWDTAPGTWWAAVNGATYYYQHKYGRSAETRLAANVLNGVAEQQKTLALTLAEQYAAGQR